MEHLPEYELILTRNKITIGAIFGLLGTLEFMELTTFTGIDEERSGLIELKKKATPVGIDYSAFEEVFFPWNYSFTDKDDLTLSVENTKLYLEMWFIAMNYLKDQKYRTGLNTEAMSIYYNALLITMAKIHEEQMTEDDEDFRLN